MIKGQLSAFEGKREKPFIFIIVLEHLLYISTHWDSPLFCFFCFGKFIRYFHPLECM